MFRSKQKVVLIEQKMIFRSILEESQKVSPQNEKKYKPYLKDDGTYEFGRPYKYKDLKYPQHTFSMITEKLSVIPQIGDRIGNLGVVENREIYFENPINPPLTKKLKRSQSKNGNFYDVKLTLKPKIEYFFGETFNDCRLDEIKIFYENYWWMYQKLGWDNFNKMKDNQFWNDWGNDLSEKGLFDD